MLLYFDWLLMKHIKDKLILTNNGYDENVTIKLCLAGELVCSN